MHLAGDQSGEELRVFRSGVTELRELSMRDNATVVRGRPLRAGSLCSGHGGLDLAVEHAFHAETIWFSEIYEPINRVFGHHWPRATNLADIATIDWSTVQPVDVLCGGFPCQDVSIVGKQTGLAPGTRSGLWSHTAIAIDALKPAYVVIENVRGLLSAPAARAATRGTTDDRCNRNTATLAGGATPADARAWNRYARGVGRSRSLTRLSTSPSTDRMARRAKQTSRRRSGP
ncbi:MAG TPA: DNA cytosine methyltransferase [Beutenbergiaceae bacterium]|nr:DNA cytosine methyltransferase [Beutenbergiaceae bacterium]